MRQLTAAPVCGTRWQKVETEGERRPALIRLADGGDWSFQGNPD